MAMMLIAAMAALAVPVSRCRPDVVLGCYDDTNLGPYGLLPSPQPQLHDKVTLENCATACTQVGLPVAGVDGGKHGGCGSPADLAWNREVAMAECQTTPCHGDPAEKGCGGLNRTVAFNFTCSPPAPPTTPAWTPVVPTPEVLAWQVRAPRLALRHTRPV